MQNREYTKKVDVTVWIDKVVAKERPRKGARGNFYTPKKTKEFEEYVGWRVKEAGFKNPSPSAFGVSLTVTLKPPSKSDYAIGDYAKESLVDWDNVFKAVLDGMNGVVYDDDNQVCSVIGQKRWGSETGCWVRIWELGDE